MEYKKKGIREQLFQYYFLFTEIDLFKISDEYGLFGRPYRIVDYLLLAGLV